MRAGLLIALTFVFASAMGCGAATAPSPSPPPRPDLGPLPLLVPAGAKTILDLRPSELLVSTATQRLVGALTPEAALRVFTTRTGIDPRQVTQAIFAEYDDGALILVRGPFDARLVVEETGARMATVESTANEPFVRRAGFIGNDRVEVVALERDVLLVGSGLASAVGEVVGCVRHRDEAHCDPALALGAPRSLYEEHKRAQFVLYVPQALDLPDGLGASSLLSGVTGMALVLTPIGSEAIMVDVDLRGTFPSGADENFRILVTNVGATELGTALGIDSAAERLNVEQRAGSVAIHGALPLTTLITGLRALFVADIYELLNGAPRSHETR